MSKILVVRIGNLGDVLMATPVPRILRKNFPDAQIDFLTSPQALFTVENNNYIDNVYVYSKYKKILRKVCRWVFKQRLLKKKYDFCIVLENNPEYVKFCCDVVKNSGKVFGFSVNGCAGLLEYSRDFDYTEHVVVNYMNLLQDCFDIEYDQADYGLDLFRAGEHKSEIENGEKYFLVHPGCTINYPYRGWKKENFSRVIDYVVSKGYKVKISGLGSDKDLISSIVANCQNKDVVETFIGKGLNGWLELIDNASCVLCPDTGILHVARAFNVPVVALFGCSNPEHTGPIGNGQYGVVTKNFECGPCNYYYEYAVEDKKNCMHGDLVPCMDAISPEDVIEAIDRII